MFIENITQILSVIKNSKKTVIVGGDFNIDILNYIAIAIVQEALWILCLHMVCFQLFRTQVE